MSKILFVTSELFPLVKTGGLADVSRSLPEALTALGHEVVIVIPGYAQVIAGVDSIIKKTDVKGAAIEPNTQLWLTRLESSVVPVWVVVNEALYARDGGPYEDPFKRPWPDNAKRFANFCQTVVAVVKERSLTNGWKPDVVHCNDWQSGLIAPLLSLEATRPKTVFTIHNLAYQGVFDAAVFHELGLPPEWWSYDKLEFHGQLSFLKGGIVFSDYVTTVSPRYAKEILTPEYGCGMEGLLSHYAHKLKGILNGADYSVWSPESDPYIKYPYNKKSLQKKCLNKDFMQKQLGFRQGSDHLMVGLVGRLVHQKGIDLLEPMIRELIGKDMAWVLLGSGDEGLEKDLLALAAEFPQKVSVTIGYSEIFAHQIEAAADVFLMPSRYEPCGLNQIYSLKYGTLPLVRNTGGLSDTVVAFSDQTIADESATGFRFESVSSDELIGAMVQALKLFNQKKIWKTAQLKAMAQDFSWGSSALEYAALYESANARLIGR